MRDPLPNLVPLTSPARIAIESDGFTSVYFLAPGDKFAAMFERKVEDDPKAWFFDRFDTIPERITGHIEFVLNSHNHESGTLYTLAVDRERGRHRKQGDAS